MPVFKHSDGCGHDPKYMKELKKEREELRIAISTPMMTFLDPDKEPMHTTLPFVMDGFWPTSYG